MSHCFVDCCERGKSAAEREASTSRARGREREARPRERGTRIQIRLVSNWVLVAVAGGVEGGSEKSDTLAALRGRLRPRGGGREGGGERRRKRMRRRKRRRTVFAVRGMTPEHRLAYPRGPDEGIKYSQPRPERDLNCDQTRSRIPAAGGPGNQHRAPKISPLPSSFILPTYTRCSFPCPNFC